MPCAIGGVNLDAKRATTVQPAETYFAFFAAKKVRIWVDINKDKSRKTLFDADSAESPLI